jgi:Flagellar biosynthesis protein, FliO
MWAAGRGQSAVERIVAAMLLTLLLASFRGNASGAPEPAAGSLPSSSSSGTSKAAADEGQATSPSLEPLRVPRPSGHLSQVGMFAGPPESAPRWPGSGGWWLGSVGITLVLAVCGAICVAARGYWPQKSAGSLQVVGRVSLSSRHSIFLVRVGERVLLIGTGSQGAPSLLGELTEAEHALDSDDPARRPLYSPEARTARPFEVTTARATTSLDVHLGDDE